MVRYMKKLQTGYSEKENMERLLSGLEKLKEEGSVTGEQYEFMKQDYTKRKEEAEIEIDQTRREISKEIENAQRDLDIYKQELGNLEVRFKVGELTADMYQRSEQRIRNKIDKMQTRILELKKLLESKSSADVGGYVEVRRKKAVIVGASLPTFSDISSSIRETSISDFKEFVATFEDAITPRTKLIGLIGGILIVISTLLPWVSISAPSYFSPISMSFSGFSVSGAIGVTAIIAGLVCVLAAFLERSNARGIMHIGMGILALLVLLGVWAVFSDIMGSLAGIPMVGETIKERVTIREGFYLYIISFIVMIVGGLFELGER